MGDAMFEYEVVPVVVTRGAGGSEAGEEWGVLRAALNDRGREGFRVVAVSEGAEGRAIIMERPLSPSNAAAAEAGEVAEAAEKITRVSAADAGASAPGD